MEDKNLIKYLSFAIIHNIEALLEMDYTPQICTLDSSGIFFKASDIFLKIALRILDLITYIHVFLICLIFQEKTTQPVNKSPFLNHSNLVSLYATVILKTVVLFLGTGNGQLLKVGGL